MHIRGKVVPAAGFAWLLSSALCLSAAPFQSDKATPPPAGHVAGTRLHAQGIPNFAEVTPNLFRGGQPSPAGIEALKNAGVNLIVDLRGRANKDEEESAKKFGMQYISIPLHCPFPKDKPFAKFLRVLRENPAKKVFLHCRLGDDRTGMAVASYRMAEEGWSPDEALQEMNTFGFSPLHRAMCPGLTDYEQSFPQRLKNDRAFKELQPYGKAAPAK
jgi:tyrosine-protein phosphatase SIW14